MKTTAASRKSFVRFLVTAIPLLLILGGCYHGIGRELFYRLEYHSFRVVDPEGRPLDGRKMQATFEYQSNFDISGMHTLHHFEPIRFDEKGRASRFGWVRHTAHLHGLYIPGYYPYYDPFIPERGGNTITLLPVRYPTPLFYGKVAFRVKEKYCGKLQFRFSDLELSMPFLPLRWKERKTADEWQKPLDDHQPNRLLDAPGFVSDFTPEERLAYRWNDREKREEWQRITDKKYQPDLVFDIGPNGRITAEFTQGAQPEFRRHHSTFSGPYYAPPPGYYKRLPIENRYDSAFKFSSNPIVFSFPFQGKNCYGVLRSLRLETDGRIEFEFLLNLAGDSNLEPGKHIQKHGHSEELWARKRPEILPETLLKEFRGKVNLAFALQSPKRKIGEFRDEKIRYEFFGRIHPGDGLARITQVEYGIMEKQLFGFGSLYQLPNDATGCKPEVRDVNFDGYPDLILHGRCGEDGHRYRFFITHCHYIVPPNLRSQGYKKYVTIDSASAFDEKLQGNLSFEPAKRLIHVDRREGDGKIVRKTYRVASDPKIYPSHPKYLTEVSLWEEPKP